ncbi:MAG: hypothetical protein OEV07_11240, partial [Gammaproteobacteria bacterium]|nr:hypothetical protein [Gammaproteobacteria bacterium]
MPDPAVHSNYYEAPAATPDVDEIWCYCDCPCYSPGDRIGFHVSTTAKTYRLEIARDGIAFEILFNSDALPGKRHDTPTDASVVGCGWPVGFEFKIPDDWPSGGYRVTSRIETTGGIREQHHLFLLRANHAERAQRMLLVSSTGTWCAYNNWGGSNHYEGITGPAGSDYSPILSLHRPLPRGFVVLPVDAPRAALAAAPAHDEPVSYPHME